MQRCGEFWRNWSKGSQEGHEGWPEGRFLLSLAPSLREPLQGGPFPSPQWGLGSQGECAPEGF